jgi:hypothetical protein
VRKVFDDKHPFLAPIVHEKTAVVPGTTVNQDKPKDKTIGVSGRAVVRKGVRMPFQSFAETVVETDQDRS